MAFLDNNGVARLWAHIVSKIGNKVDKVEGKGLSTNDYTDAEKEKLASLDATIADSLDELQATLDTTITGIQNDIDTQAHSLADLQTTFDTTIAGIQNELDTHTHSWNELEDRPFGEVGDTIIVTVPAGKSQSVPFPANTEFTVSCNGTTKTFNTSSLSSPQRVGQIQVVYSGGALVVINYNPQASNTVTLSYGTVEQLDEKYIPDTIARLTDIPVTSVNGKTGAVSLTAADVGAITAGYVDTKIAELVDSSPDTLNTLNELAAALGDDPNFATTIATEIGTKVTKVEGKGLSTNDFTNEDKEKLNNIMQSDWSQTDETKMDFIKNKPNEDDALTLLAETEFIEPVTAADSSVFTDSNGAVYTL